jgi:hypothetical protein
MNKKNYITFRAYGAEQTLCMNPVKSITPGKKTSQKIALNYSFLKTLLFVVFCFSALLAYSAYASDDVLYPSDKNNGWEIIDYDESNMITLTRTGNITNGDRLFFILYPENECNYADIGFFVYSEKDVKDYGELVHKTLAMKIGNQVDYEFLNAFVVANDRFLNGFRSFLSIGTYGMDQLLRGFGKVDTIMFELIDVDEELVHEVGLEKPDDLSVNDYFDITKNVWTMHGFDSYIMKAQSACQAKRLDPEATA